MKYLITNNLNLPEPYIRAVENDPYDPDDGGTKSDYTITGLLKPARMAALNDNAEITEDATDRLYSLQGQLMHAILERAKPELEAEGFVIEKRFYKSYLVNDRIFVVSAKIDVYDPVQARVSDYKYTSVGSSKKGLKYEHYYQVNFQAELLRHAGFPVEKADTTLLLRDWSKERTYQGYPVSPCVVQPVQLLPPKEVDKFIIGRISAHEAAKTTLPLCTDEERWSRPTFAVMKDNTATRALRVFDTKEEAESFITAKGIQTAVLVARAGQSIRCMRYCPVRSICEQGRKEATAAVVDADGFIKVT